MLRAAVVGGALLAFAAGYWLSLRQLASASRTQGKPELLVSLPRFAQVLLAGGDRHLAANLSGFRVLVAATEKMGAGDYAVQGRLQRDIAWLNPAHEDNYYIAAATLPWNGEPEAARQVLRRAADARRDDWQPLFYLGFHHYHFLKDPAEGARLLLEAAPRAREEEDRWALQNVAAKWLEKGYSTATAAAMVEAMASSAPAGNFRRYLQLRAKRLQHLARLRDLAESYKARRGRPLTRIGDLVGAGLIDAIPDDPLGEGFSVDRDGVPVFWAEERERP